MGQLWAWGRYIVVVGMLLFQAHLVLAQAAEVSVMTWNIHKGQAQGWEQVISKNPADIILLQEITSDPEQVLIPLETALGPEYLWRINPAWTMFDGFVTGTMNVSKFKSLNQQLLLTEDVEPIAATPKSMIVSDYEVPGCGVVRVINLHMLNFNLGAAYGRQLKQLESYIEEHQGPLVVAGDFNSWNGFRESTMQNWAQNLDLIQVDVYRYSWFLVLDHVFYKNLSLVQAEEIPTDLSDHNPMRAEFDCH